jgi:hypothetical protein
MGQRIQQPLGISLINKYHIFVIQHFLDSASFASCFQALCDYFTPTGLTDAENSYVRLISKQHKMIQTRHFSILMLGVVIKVSVVENE